MKKNHKINMTFEEFREFFYEYQFFPNGLYCKPTKKYNEAELRRKHKDYLRSIEKQKERHQKQVERQMNKVNEMSAYQEHIFAVEAQARSSNPNGEYFWSRLTDDQAHIVRQEMMKIPDFKQYDPCHVIARSVSRKLAIVEANIVIAPRAFHTYIDSMLDPFTAEHEFIGRAEHDNIWIQIIGQETWTWLQENK